jgi:hypothetical protein
MTRHQLKTWPDYFSAVIDGTKTFELRINDRDYKVGDVLELQEYSPSAFSKDDYSGYSGRTTEVIVTYIFRGSGASWGLYKDAVVMSIKLTEAAKLRAQKACSTDPERLERMAQEIER